MLGAQVVAMRLSVGREWTQDGRGIGIHIRQRRCRGAGTRGPGTTTRGAHGRTLARVAVLRVSPRHESSRPASGLPATLPKVARRFGIRRDQVAIPATRRDRHGRGVRGPLAPAGSPLALSRAERFDELVVDIVDRLNRRLGHRLASVEFAVEDVPSMDDWNRDWVPLARTYAAEGALPARVVVFRRPVETRATVRRQLRHLVGDVLAEQVAELLGVDPDEVDPLYGSARDD